MFICYFVQVLVTKSVHWKWKLRRHHCYSIVGQIYRKIQDIKKYLSFTSTKEWFWWLFFLLSNLIFPRPKKNPHYKWIKTSPGHDHILFSVNLYWKCTEVAFPGPPSAQLKSLLVSGQTQRILIKHPQVPSVEVFPYSSQWSWWISSWELSLKPFWWMSKSATSVV